MNVRRKRQRIVGKELNDLWKIKGSMLCPLGNPGKKSDNNPLEPTKIEQGKSIDSKGVR